MNMRITDAEVTALQVKTVGYRYRVNEPLISPLAEELVQRVLRSGYLSPGEFTRAFERAWAEICGTQYGVACNSGTAALHLAMLALRVERGAEVIVPALTCPDTINAVVMAGGKPVIVDVEDERLGLDPQHFENAITPRTVGVVPVHLYGVPVRREIFEIARKHRLWVVEDCAEAHGASYSKERGVEFAPETQLVGSVGTIGCFSFRGDKIIGIGTGGMLVTNDPALEGRARYLIGLASGGGFERYYSTEMGFSYECDNVRGALGLAQVELLPDVLRGKARVAYWYDSFFQENARIEFADRPQWVTGSAWWKYAVRLKRLDAHAAYLALERLGIETSPPFVPLYRLPMYRGDYLDAAFDERFPIAEDAYKRLLCLPSSPRLQFEDVCEIVKAFDQVCQ